jgi:hypothetical protein
MARNWWIWALLTLMAVSLALGATLNFTSAFLALPVLLVVLLAGFMLRAAAPATETYDPPDHAKATGHRLPRTQSGEER